MLALILENGGIRLRQVEVPVPLPGEALVKVRIAGICRTDLELARGYLNFRGIIGHEFVGEIVECLFDKNNETICQVGQRVVGEINCGCGYCDQCRIGLQRHCPNRTVLGIQGRDGALAEYLTLPLENLHPVPDSVSDQAAVFTEPLAAALEMLEQIHIKPDTRALVVGDGKLGLLAARVLQIRGCDLLALGSHENKMAVLESWGLSVLPHAEYRPDARDLVVETSGSAEGFALAVSAVRPRGTLILKSTYHGSLTLDTARLVIHEITVVGSRCGPFAPALRLLKQKLVDTESLISAVFPFGEMEVALKYASQPEALKVLIDFQELEGYAIFHH